MSSLVASAVLYGRAEPTTTTNSTSPGNETTTGCEHVNPDNLSEDQMFAAAAVIAVCCTLTAVTLAIFTWKKRWLFLQDTSIAICLGACIGAAVTYGSGGKYEQTVIMNSSVGLLLRVLLSRVEQPAYLRNRLRIAPCSSSSQ